jgi:hypothetical protein
MPGDFLDLSSEASPPQSPERIEADASSTTNNTRKFVSIHFVCCNIYHRIYINRQQTAYVGHCPRCSHRVELKIGPEGSNSRFFTAG